MSLVIHGIDNPFCTRMRCFLNAIHYRIAHALILMSHIDLALVIPSPLIKLPGHALEKIEVFSTVLLR